MEAEVVRMCIDLFNGDDEACGSVSRMKYGHYMGYIGCVNNGR